MLEKVYIFRIPKHKGIQFGLDLYLYDKMKFCGLNPENSRRLCGNIFSFDYDFEAYKPRDVSNIWAVTVKLQKTTRFTDVMFEKENVSIFYLCSLLTAELISKLFLIPTQFEYYIEFNLKSCIYLSSVT